MAALPRLSELPTPTTLGELLAVLGRIETDQLDFKRVPARLNELIPAFAMTDGGLIVLGIKDDRTLHGCELTQKVADEVTRTARNVGVEVQLRELEVDDEKVVVVAVPEVRGRIVTTTEGRLLRRVGSDVHPLIGDQLSRFVREREDVPGEEEAVTQVSATDFDLDLINQALAIDGRPPVEAAEYHRALIDLAAK